MKVDPGISKIKSNQLYLWNGNMYSVIYKLPDTLHNRSLSTESMGKTLIDDVEVEFFQYEANNLPETMLATNLGPVILDEDLVESSLENYHLTELPVKNFLIKTINTDIT